MVNIHHGSDISDILSKLNSQCEGSNVIFMDILIWLNDLKITFSKSPTSANTNVRIFYIVITSCLHSRHFYELGADKYYCIVFFL